MHPLYMTNDFNESSEGFCLGKESDCHQSGISWADESDRDCDNGSSHIHVKIPHILKNLNEAAPATKRPEDSAIRHLPSIQETA
jgi:hypothetical protein